MNACSNGAAIVSRPGMVSQQAKVLLMQRLASLSDG
jgi:hypothetical protein